MKNKLLILFILLNLLLLGQVNGIFPTLNRRLPAGSGTPVSGNNTGITAIVAQAVPSVITVKISQTVSNYSIEFDPTNPFAPFKKVPGQTYQTSQNIGSGFVIGANGIILTNKHVVSDQTAAYSVITNDKQEYPVVAIYRDPANDLALLKINTTSLTPLPLGDSSNLKLGEAVVAIGTPLGQFTNTVTSGIISGLGRGITTGSVFEGSVEKLDNVIQTDAPINPGNSGGPLLDAGGKVIGINTAIAAQGQNIGFAIPVSAIKQLLAKNNLI
jgi:S1-C subfamily serine protease